MSQDANNECSRAWETNQISEYRPQNGYTIPSPQHRSHYRPEPSQPQLITNCQPSPATNFADEIRNLMSQHGTPLLRSRPKYPSYPRLPPPTAYRNSNRNTPLRALPLTLSASNPTVSRADQTSENDNNKLCQFFAKISQSNSSIAVQNSTNNNQNQILTSTMSHHNIQRQVQMGDQRAQVNESHLQAHYKNQAIQAANSRLGLDGYASRTQSMVSCPQRSQQQSQQSQYITYPCRQVSHVIVPNQQLNNCQNLSPQGYSQNPHLNAVQSRLSLQELGSRDSNQHQDNDSLTDYPQNNPGMYQSNELMNNQTGDNMQCQQRDRTVYNCHQNDQIFQQQQNETMYDHHCQQNNGFYTPSQSEAIYYHQPPQPMAPHLQQQVNIQQAHLTLKTTQVATVAGNFHNPCVAAMYPSLCNIWGQPAAIPCQQSSHPTSPPSNLLQNQQSQHQLNNLIQPIQYMGQTSQIPSFPNAGMTPAQYSLTQGHPQYQQNVLPPPPAQSNSNYKYNGNQGMSISDSNLTKNDNSHNVADLGTRSDSHLQLNQSGSPQQPKKRQPWSIRNAESAEKFNDHPYKCSGNQNQESESLQRCESSSSLSGNENNRLADPTHSKLSKRSDGHKNGLSKSKVKGKTETFSPGIEEILKNMEKDITNKTLEEGLEQLQHEKWINNVLGLKVIILQARSDPDKLVDQLGEVLFQVHQHLKSPKSKLCRQAISCFKELFFQLGPLMDGQLEEVVDILLRKTMDTNKFIKDECETALEAMVRSCSPAKVVACLESNGRNHKNVIVRRMSCRMTRVFIDYWGPSTCLVDHGKELLPMLYSFMEEPTNDIREEAKKALKMIMTLPQFDESVEKFVNPLVAQRVHDRVERIRDEILNRTPRRRRKKNENHLF